VFSLLGCGAWIGVTVYVAATNEDPSDARPILRTFAVAGAVFLGTVLVAAAVQMRRRATAVGSLYDRLALHEMPRRTVRAAARRARGWGHVHLLFAAATSGLMLTAVGLGEEGPTAALLYTGVALVLVWAVAAIAGLRRAFAAGDELLAPLGLSIAAVPTWVAKPYGGGIAVVGELGIVGERHGREVSIVQRTDRALTTVRGRFAARTVSSPATMAALTGEPAKSFRKVEAVAGPDGVAVRRRGNGAGRFVYHDLLLAESLAATTSTVAAPAPG
jgi:hypothetical protein